MGPGLLADDAPSGPAAGTQDLHSRNRQLRHWLSRTRRPRHHHRTLRHSRPGAPAADQSGTGSAKWIMRPSACGGVLLRDLLCHVPLFHQPGEEAGYVQQVAAASHSLGGTRPAGRLWKNTQGAVAASRLAPLFSGLLRRASRGARTRAAGTANGSGGDRWRILTQRELDHSKMRVSDEIAIRIEGNEQVVRRAPRSTRYQSHVREGERIVICGPSAVESRLSSVALTGSRSIRAARSRWTASS